MAGGLLDLYRPRPAAAAAPQVGPRRVGGVLPMIESAGKGLLRTVGIRRPLDPEESAAVATGAEIAGNIAMFIPALRVAGVATRGLTALPVLARGALQTGLAAGGQELAKQTIGAIAGERPDLRQVGLAGLYGAAIPPALAAVGGTLGKAAGLAARAAGVEKVPVGKLAGEVVERTVGRIPAVRRFQHRLAYQTQTPERSISYQSPKWGEELSSYLNSVEKGGGPNTPVALDRGARILSGLARDIAGQAEGATQPLVKADLRAAARELERAALFMRGTARKGGSLSSAGIERIVGARLYPALGRRPFLRAEGGLNVPGQLVSFMRDILLLDKPGTRGFEKVVRSGVAHIYIGVGNPASAITNLSSVVTNTAAKEGVGATMWAVQNLGTPVAKLVGRNVIGRGMVSLQLGVSPSTLAGRASMLPFMRAEVAGRTVAGLARWYNMTQGGMRRPAALREAIKAAREQFFDFQWNLPAFLRRSGPSGEFTRVMLQFYPFILNQANFMSSLNAQEFARFATHMFAVGGSMAVPFAQIADRLVAAYTGWSVIERLKQSPKLWKQVVAEGPTAVAAGVSLGSRVEFTTSLIQRWLTLEDVPFRDIVEKLASATQRAIARPDDTTLKKVGRVALGVLEGVEPTAVRRVAQAVEAERTGGFQTQRGLPVAKVQTERELGLKALGFSPLTEAKGRGVTQTRVSLEARHERAIEDARRDLRIAAQSRDPEALTRAVRILRQRGGLRKRDIKRLVREALMKPEIRELRRTPRVLRRELVEFLREPDEEEEE